MNEADLIQKGYIKDAAGNWRRPERRRLTSAGDQGTSAQSERIAGDALAQAAPDEAAHSGKFAVCVTSYRKTLLDEDNLVEKYHVDAVRYAGILPGDSPEQASIQVRQVKVETDGEENTRIVISPIKP